MELVSYRRRVINYVSAVPAKKEAELARAADIFRGIRSIFSQCAAAETNENVFIFSVLSVFHFQFSTISKHAIHLPFCETPTPSFPFHINYASLARSAVLIRPLAKKAHTMDGQEQHG